MITTNARNKTESVLNERENKKPSFPLKNHHSNKYNPDTQRQDQRSRPFLPQPKQHSDKINTNDSGERSSRFNTTRKNQDVKHSKQRCKQSDD